MQRCASKECYICGGKSATIMCKYKSCKRWFHLVCGADKYCLFQFNDPFSSYCHEHHNINDGRIEGHDSCMVCWEPMGTYNPITSIPSCCEKGWIHVRCMRKAAITAGYYFKCPLCGHNRDGYLPFVRKRGIFVPDQDAVWELSQNAYGSLLLQYNRCDAKVCHCENGREFSIKRKRSKWFLLKCIYCGSKAIHFGCSPHDLKEYKCSECTSARSQMLFSQEFPFQQSQQQNEMTKALTAGNGSMVLFDLTVDENWNQTKHQLATNSRSDTSKLAPLLQVMEVSSSTNRKAACDEEVEVIETDALVSVKEFGDNPFKERTIILARDAPPSNTQFVENNRELSSVRLDVLWMYKNK